MVVMHLDAFDYALSGIMLSTLCLHESFTDFEKTWCIFFHYNGDPMLYFTDMKLVNSLVLPVLDL